jgi:3-dehydroquinate synthase
VNKSIEQMLEIPFRYQVHFTRNLFASENLILLDVVRPEGKRKPKIIIALDHGLLKARPDLSSKMKQYANDHDLQVIWPVLELPGGESIKQSTAAVEQVLEAIHLRGIDRHSYVIAIGGGAVLDAVGYAAAIAHRGVRHIRIPTTVLSQNDSGVGIKNAINYFERKNWLGTFAPPHAVLNDLDFLDGLDDREWRSGTAEAVKVALIKDRSFFEELEQLAPKLVARDRVAMERLVFRSAELHLHQIASGDPFERQSARRLDFGHWVAHRLEFLSDYRIRHGEAVAIGIAVDVTYCRLAGYLGAIECSRILTLLEGLGFNLWATELACDLEDYTHPRSIIRGMEEFREHLGGELTVTLLKDIGVPFEVHEFDLPLLEQGILELHCFSQRADLTPASLAEESGSRPKEAALV